MRKIFILFACFFMIQAQAQNLFLKTYSTGSDIEDTHSLFAHNTLLQTGDGGYLIAATSGYSTFNDILLIRTNATGDSLWTKRYGKKDVEDIAYSISPTQDGGYIIIGTQGSYTDLIPYAVRIKANGDTLWTRTYPETGFFSRGKGAVELADGSFLLGIDRFKKNFNQDENMHLIKINSGGDTVWTKPLIIGTFTRKDYFKGFYKAKDGNLMIACESGSTPWTEAGQFSPVLIKLDANYDTAWIKGKYALNSDANYPGHIYQFGQCTDGGFIISDFRYIVGVQYVRIYLIRTDANGDTLWTKALDHDNRSARMAAVKQCSDGGFILGGFIAEVATPSYNDVVLMKSDSTGVVQWKKTFHNSNDERGFDVMEAADGSYVIHGILGNYFLANTDKNGNAGTGFFNAEKLMSNVQIYPNPFSNSATISHPELVPGSRSITLSLYNILGKEVLNREVKGLKTEISRGDLPAGIYFYRLISPGHAIATGKLIIE